MPVDGGAAGAATAAGGGACWAYSGSGGAASSAAAWSLAAHRPAWRRDTRLETAVAVPAMTAVRATPRMRPGMFAPSSLVFCWWMAADRGCARRGDRRYRDPGWTGGETGRVIRTE